MRDVRVLIAGAGPCGLGAALEIVENGPGAPDDFLLGDPGKQAGGWAGSRTTAEGFTFDFGGHVLFPHKHYQRFAELLHTLPIDWARSTPKRGVQTEGHFLPYPAQRNLQRLPLGKLLRALGSVALHRRIAAATMGKSSDLGSYLKHHFGSYLTDLLMAPLNRKQWAHEPEQLTDVWTRHRSGSSTRNVADINLKRVVGNFLLGEDDPGWGPETKVAYPAQGGSGAIWTAVASAVPAEKMLLQTRIVSVSLAKKTALLSTGETVRWEHLVTTMPLDTLLRSLEDEPELTGKAKRFVKARSRLFGFGVRGALPDRYAGLHSCQVTDADVPFWRLNFPTTVSRGNGPEGCWSMLCEVSEPGGQPGRGEAELRGAVEASLRKMGLLSEGGTEIVSRWEYSIEHGYPVPFLERDALLSDVQPRLEAANVYSRGRFGTWRYEISNQDHAFMQGVEVARRILFRLPEETYGNAVAVNEAASPEPETRQAVRTLEPAMEAIGR